MTGIAPLEGLPVRVQGVEVQDPVLTVFGEGWGLTIACPWEGTVGDRDVSWEDDDIEDRSWDLVGQDLVSVQQEGIAVRVEFSAATIIMVPDTDVDPWVLQLSGGLIVGRVT